MSKKITWQKLEAKKQTSQIVGFLPFQEGAVLTGRIEKCIMKGDTKGFFLVRTEEPCIVNTTDASNIQSQVEAPTGSLVGCRYCHALRACTEMVGRIVRLTFLETEKRNGKLGDYVYHCFDIEVGEESENA